MLLVRTVKKPSPIHGIGLEAGPVFGVDVAARDIEPGEELTCDYTTFDRVDRDGLSF